MKKAPAAAPRTGRSATAGLAPASCKSAESPSSSLLSSVGLASAYEVMVATAPSDLVVLEVVFSSEVLLSSSLEVSREVLVGHG